jgi:hypothetical protein
MREVISRLAAVPFLTPGRLATLVLALFFTFTLQARADQSIILRSGNGAVGSQDSQVRFLAYGRGGDITPAASDFVTVQTGTYAYIDAPYPTYIQSLPTDPLAHWISTTPDLGAGSALYAIPFMVTDTVIGSASLDLGYAVDNAINGIYINGTLISGNSHDGDYHGEYYELRSDIAPLLKPNAVNWLFINTSDYGGYAGIIFNATIMVQGGSAGAPSISPNQGGNTGQVSVRIIGSGFQPAQPDSTGSQFNLTGIGPEIDATNVSVMSPNIITGTFDLTGAAPGVRTVTVTTPNEAPLVLANDFTVVSSGGCTGTTLQAMGTPPVKGRAEIFYLTYQNNCSVDSGPITIVEPLEPWSIYNPPPGDNPAEPAPTQTDPFTVPNLPDPYPGQNQWTLPSLPPGGSGTISVPVIEDPSYPAGQPVQAIGCTATQLTNLANTCEQQLQTGLNLANACKDLASTIGFGDEACDLAIVEDYAEYGVCMAGGHAVCKYFPSLVRGSVDPNDLTGPVGYGSQGWFQDNAPLQYTLSYNNLPTATNPATDVYLADTFDPATMDLASLTIGAISIPGGQYLPPNIPLAGNPFTHDIDLRPEVQLLVRVSAALDLATSQVNISLHTLDPNTGLTPADPTIGFLQPGAGGSVLFALNSKPGLSTGTAVKDNASVIFDSNAAIQSPQWLNTVDITPPVSHVVALPATETSTSFNVSWTGTDVGSGIANYSIYVSDDGGSFQYWLLNTMATSGTYTGVVGHTYAFYSIAEDGAGNIEAAKTSGDTTTEVVPTSSKTAVTWSIPASITYGTALSAAQLDAVASVPGGFTYSPAAGTVPHAGIQTLSAMFTPANTAEYTTASATVPLVVNKAPTTVTWTPPAAITYGTALSVAQLDATSTVPGSFYYYPLAGTTLPLGAQTLSVTFIPTDSADYLSSTATVPLTVNQGATPEVSWTMPAPIAYGTALSAAQLDAVSSVPGSFSYSPAAGTALKPGIYPLSASFTPTNTNSYALATAQTLLVVSKAPTSITWLTPAPISAGTALSAAQLDATASVPGNFYYNAIPGELLPAGQHTLSVTFIPTDTADYLSSTASVTLTVNGPVVAANRK